MFVIRTLTLNGGGAAGFLDRLLAESARPLWIERKIKLLLPIESGPGPGYGIVAGSRSWTMQCDVGGMRRDFKGDHAIMDILDVGQTKMLLGGDITEQGGTMESAQGPANGTREMVIAGGAIRHQRTEDVERRTATTLLLPFDVIFDLIQRDMPGTFHHALHSGGTAAGGKFT